MGDFNYMKDFIKVVEYKSLNKVSRELNISTLRDTYFNINKGE